MNDHLHTPVVLILFRRPDSTRRVWEKIRAARPEKLFLIADGPRNIAEQESCAAARRVTESVDWPCEVRRNFSDANLGSRERVFSGLDWVFEQVEDAIILEDDCVPDLSFFRFCAELLARYRDNPRVATIAGDNFQNGRRFGAASYYFTAHAHCWGWATWRHAWQRCDKSMAGWPEFKARGRMREFFSTEEEVTYWTANFDRAHRGEWKWAWDHAWWFSQLAQGACGVCPQTNLVENIGFGGDATHTFEATENFPPPSAALSFPLRHPARVAIAAAADRRYFETICLCQPPLRPAYLETLALNSPWLAAAIKKIRGSAAWKIARNRRFREQWREKKRVAQLPRHAWSETTLLGATLKLNDPFSFLAQFAEIFEQEIYRFNSDRPAPRILDVGGNLGLASIYFKRAHPAARVTCFEADSEIAAALRANLAAHGLADVEVVDRAVSTHEAGAAFLALGGGSGRLRVASDAASSARSVPTVRLRDYLAEPVDFLKLDIEGAELDVLLDCGDRLRNVAQAFVEYHSFAGEPSRLDELLALLRECGFRVRIDSAGRLDHPFVSTQTWDGMDFLLHVYATREDRA